MSQKCEYIYSKQHDIIHVFFQLQIKQNDDAEQREITAKTKGKKASDANVSNSTCGK